MKRLFVLFLFGIAWLGFQVDALAQIAIPRPMYELTESFVEDDFVWSLTKGTGVIAGQGFLRAPGGFIKTAEEEEVTLVAKTPYTDEIVAATRQDGFFDKYTNVQKDLNYSLYRRVQTADKEGRFRFENLPAGEWYIVTKVIWYMQDESSNYSYGGGLVWGQITIGEGEVRDNVELNSTVHLAK